MEQPAWDIELLGDLSQVMRDASICGLGQAAPNPVDCVIKYFPHELNNQRCHERQPADRQFKINGREVQALPPRNPDRSADAQASRSRTCATRKAWKPDGNCRACVVEIDGERVLAPSCCRHPTQGMKVSTDSERAVKAQKMVLELLLADLPETDYTRHNEVDAVGGKAGRRQAALPGHAPRSRSRTRATPPSPSTSTPASSARAACAPAATSRSTT
jgi:hypothetical protein